MMNLSPYSKAVADKRDWILRR